MISQFHKTLQANAHAEFQNWRRENMDGFFLNVKTKKTGMIHRSNCLHPGSPDWQANELGDLGKQMKVCSLNLVAIHKWATNNGITHLSECSDCKPVDDQRIMTEIAEELLDRIEFNPDNVVDERKRILHDIVLRQGQPAFRKTLLDAYEGRCVITGCSVNHVLEAAHIYPYQGNKTNDISNGLLLRSDIHTLFDLKLLTVHPETLEIYVSPTLASSHYGELHKRKLREPIGAENGPSKLALRKHFESSGLE